MYNDGPSFDVAGVSGLFPGRYDLLAKAIYYSPLAIGLRLMRGGTVWGEPDSGEPDSGAAGPDLPSLIQSDTITPRPRKTTNGFMVRGAESFGSTLGSEIGSGVKWSILLVALAGVAYLVYRKEIARR